MAKNMTPEIERAFVEKADKYCQLVWYARSGCRLDHHPPEIKAKVLKARDRVEGLYPKEITHYNHGGGDWDHGFNSGCLAAFRYVLTALCERNEIDEFGEEFVIGGLAEAEEEFPMLDT